MLYLVQPDRRMKWTDMLPDSMIFKAVEERGLDLTQLEWKEAERQADDTTVRLALRHGRETSVGLVLEAWIVGLQDRPRDIRETHRAASVARAKLEPQNKMVDAILGPGSTEYRTELDARVDESVKQSAAEADEELEEKLAGEAKPSLVECWASLGGRLPRPA